MRHYYIDENSGAHFASSISSNQKYVLIQLQDEFGTQVRIKLSKKEALSFAQLVENSASQVLEEQGE